MLMSMSVCVCVYVSVSIPLAVDVLTCDLRSVAHATPCACVERVAITGMNDAELKSNKAATDYSLKDLNNDPMLSQYEDNTFDFVTNVVSIDYLNKPKEVSLCAWRPERENIGGQWGSGKFRWQYH